MLVDLPWTLHRQTGHSEYCRAGVEAKAAAVQLAAYRLAWARLCGIPDDDVYRVRAAFHYVRTNETVEPASLLDAVELRELIAG